MSLLIKGIEMPIDTYLTLNIYPDGRVATNLDANCATAISVPTPHGDLIDRDKLKADNPRHMNADVPYVTEVTVEEIIDAAPTVIEADE